MEIYFQKREIINSKRTSGVWIPYTDLRERGQSSSFDLGTFHIIAPIPKKTSFTRKQTSYRLSICASWEDATRRAPNAESRCCEFQGNC